MFLVIVLDYIDEDAQGCDEGFAKCPTSNDCIRESYFCDGENDCEDNSDETINCRKHIIQCDFIQVK
jgi:Low-density lipoprotein receptor domain class A